jgi:midasin
MVVLHLDDATDSKALLGAYVCGDAPGEFRWQPGALSQALTLGRWLLLEDADAAPPDVLAALLPLLEGRALTVPGRVEPIAPAPGFRLFGSISSSADGSRRRELAFAGLWTRVHVAPPSADELADILRGLYPAAAALVPPMLDTLASVRVLCGQAASAVPLPRVVSIGRDFTLRDVVKWGNRMMLLHGADVCADAAASFAAERLAELAFMEGADILAGVLAPGAGRDALLVAVAAAWGLPPERSAHYATLHKPGVASSDGVLHVGRTHIALHGSASAGLGAGYALTGHAARTLERLAAAVACCEPVLLIGETGTGKTAAVQALARAAGARLVVVNMSTQSDSADLLGGFKPREPGALCLPLAATFAQLFADTFPREPNSEFAARVVRRARIAAPPRLRWHAPHESFRPMASLVRPRGFCGGRIRDLRCN